MKKLGKATILIAWLLGATIAVTRWWNEHPDAIPSPPQAFSLWLLNLFNAQCCESAAAVELFYTVSVSFILISLGTLLVWGLYKRWRR